MQNFNTIDNPSLEKIKPLGEKEKDKVGKFTNMSQPIKADWGCVQSQSYLFLELVRSAMGYLAKYFLSERSACDQRRKLR